MKIIILAAGKGSRLLPLTTDKSKLMIKLDNGKTILEEQLERMEKSGAIDSAVYILGYGSRQIEQLLQNYSGKIKITTIYNPFYSVSNNLLSLWLAKGEMKDEFMITNGDNIFHHSIYKQLAENPSDGIVLTINRKDTYTYDDMKVLVKSPKGVIKVSKELPNGNAESVGLVKIGHFGLLPFLTAMNELARDENYINKFWLEIFNKISEKDLIPITPYEIDGENKWQEIDYHLDLQDVKRLLRLKEVR